MRVLPALFNPIVKYSEFLWNISQNLVKTPTRVFSLSHQVFSENNSEWGSKKKHRKVNLQLLEHQKMSDPKIEEILAPLRQKVKIQVSWKR